MHGLANGARFSLASRHKRVYEGGDLSHRSPIDPVVAPEFAAGSVAKVPGGRRPKDGGDVGVVRDMKVAPRSRGVRALQPKPSRTQSDSGAV